MLPEYELNWYVVVDAPLTTLVIAIALRFALAIVPLSLLQSNVDETHSERETRRKEYSSRPLSRESVLAEDSVRRVSPKN